MVRECNLLMINILVYFYIILYCCKVDMREAFVYVYEKKGKGLTAYVDSLYSTYLVVLIRLSYDDSMYLVIENMTYDYR